MSNLVNHGASCCGVRHIYSMDNSTVRQLEEQIATVDAIPRNGGSETSGRLIEIILSSRQVGERNPRGETGSRWAPCVAAEGGWPAVMQRLGFRLVSRFENKNSGADCYIFHRVPRFKSIRPADLPFAWDHGSYQRQAALDEGGQGDRAAVPPIAAATFPVGVSVRCTGRNWGGADYPRGVGIVTYSNERRVVVRWGNNQESTYGLDNYNFTIVAAEPVEIRPARTVATFFRNRFADGRDGALYPNVDAARRSAPRCQRQERVEIRSDGTINVVPL